MSAELIRPIHPIAPTDSINRKLCCPLCRLSLPTRRLLKHHKKAKHPTCDECHKRFLDKNALEGHRTTSGHCFCRECNHHFMSVARYVDHVRTVRHTTQYECCDCGQEYPTQAHLGRHCCDCDRIFRNHRALNRHSVTGAHKGPLVNVPRIEPVVNPAVESKKARKKKERNIPCPAGDKCIKRFATPSALLNHLESGRCPSGMTRETMSNLVLTHDRNRYITNPDTAAALLQEPLAALLPYEPPAIGANFPALPPGLADNASLPNRATPPPPLDDDNISEWSVIGGVQLTPTSSCADDDWSDINDVVLTPIHSDWSLISGTHTPTKPNPSDSDPAPPSLATPRGNIRCPLCARILHNLRGLQMHMGSTAHAPKIFHCPVTFPDVSVVVDGARAKKKKQERKFSTLGGLAQHMECGACKGGVVAFRAAIRFVEEELKGLGFGEVRFLTD